ncbi:MAG: ester cyclase [Pseudomonadota bacterium]
MKAGDNRWKDFPDYILGITREIWEDRGLTPKMKEYYHPDCVVRSPGGGVAVGEPQMTALTFATLNTFPDRQLYGEDVIWTGDTDAGMLSSHRLYSEATHLGHGAFGPPTGKRLRFRIIADCFAHDGMISDEWLVRDNGAIVRQLGHAPEDWARAELAAGRGTTPLTPASDRAGPYTGRGNDHPMGARLADILTRMMAGDFAVIEEAYDRAAVLEYPGGASARSWQGADRHWLPLMASFPGAAFEIHHIIGRDDADMAPRAAVRWSLTGTHDGPGPFGPATGAPVHIMGITHAEFGPWGLRREWTVYDEVAVWVQIVQGAG